MTLNDLERRNSLYFAFFTEFDSFAGRLRHSGWRQTYNIRKISSSSYISSKTEPCSSHTVSLRQLSFLFWFTNAQCTVRCVICVCLPVDAPSKQSWKDALVIGLVTSVVAVVLFPQRVHHNTPPSSYRFARRIKLCNFFHYSRYTLWLLYSYRWIGFSAWPIRKRCLIQQA